MKKGINDSGSQECDDRLSLLDKVKHAINVAFHGISLESRIKVEKILNKNFEDPSNLIKDNYSGLSVIKNIFNKRDFIANIPEGTLDSFILELKELIEKDRHTDERYKDYCNLDSPEIKTIKHSTDIVRLIVDYQDKFDKSKGNIEKSNDVYVFSNINEFLPMLSKEALESLVLFSEKNQIIFVFDNDFDRAFDKFEDDHLDEVMDRLLNGKSADAILKMPLPRNGITA